MYLNVLFEVGEIVLSAHFAAQTKVMGMDATKGPTPEQLAAIEKVAAEFHEDWELDLKTHQIRRRPRSRYRVVRDWLWPRRHSVFSMYWWLKRLYAGKLDGNLSAYMPFTFPLKHDSMPFEGYPVKYELCGDWSVPEKDLTYLKYGPLGDQTGRVIVTDKPPLDRIQELGKLFWARLTSPFVQLTNLLIAIGGIGGGITVIWNIAKALGAAP